MEILGKSISKQSAEIILRLEESLSKPVKYAYTDPTKTKSYGQTDLSQPDAYYIYSKQDLLHLTKPKAINIPFETNILHELSHCCQIEDGFPTVRTHNYTPENPNAEISFSLGNAIGSSILDLNVDYRLKQLGYTSEYFYDRRVAHAVKEARRGNEYKEAGLYENLRRDVLGLLQSDFGLDRLTWAGVGSKK